VYPISYEADFKPDPSRVTTFFRLILAIPWLLVILFWGILFYVTHFLAWLSVIVLGHYPKWLYAFNSGVVRFLVRTSAWIYLQTDAWPPFGLGDDPNYPIRVNFPPPAARQSRLKALFRLILALPMLLVMYPVNYIHLASAVLAWLTIVFRGYLPESVNAMMTYCNAFYARVYGYLAILTDDYPPIGLEKAAGLPAAPVTPTPPPAAAA
jgi:Domain of unknown function (DUF4389)